MIRTLGLAAIIFAIFLSFRFTLDYVKNDQVVTLDSVKDEVLTKKEKGWRRLQNSKSRSPASAGSRERFPRASAPSEKDREENLFPNYGANEDETLVGSTASAIDNEVYPDLNKEYDPSSSKRRSRRSASTDPGVGDSQSDLESTPSNSPGAVVNASPSSGSSSLPPPPVSSKSSGSVSSSKLECSANIGGGTFSSSLNVVLNCSTSATISYCLSEGSCCDPSAGSTYMTPVAFGKNNSNFCLSFRGTDGFGNSSTTVQHNYAFNSMAPDLQVAHNKLVYQTTQLEGKLSIGSLDYGDPSIVGGVLNFKGSDPVIAGYPTCLEQVEDSAPLAPSVIMPESSLSHLTPAMQLDVFFTKPELIYGENFIMSYLLNTSIGDAYSCETTKVTLEDFSYFETNPSFAMTTGTVHEFSGGFTPVSFFEAPAPTITRSPAGSSMENEGGQELRSGLFGIFY
jgi:hypothetical protein